MNVVFVVGPTASGKSDLALQLAKNFDGEIFNADSLQVYKGLDIGTAKPAKKQQELTAHHLIDLAEAPAVLTAGDFRRHALYELAIAQKRSARLAIFVGGSGFYFFALEKGMFEIGKTDSNVREEVRGTPLEKLYAELKSCDPEMARRISPNDTYRIQRATEVWRATGVKPSALRKKFEAEKFSYPLLKIGLQPNREWLRQRIVERTKLMLDNGWHKEVQDLLARGFESWPPLQSVGYKELLQNIRGEISDNDLTALIVQKTMRLAKKQMTWFRRDSEISWFDPQQGWQKPHEAVRTFLGLT